MCLGRIGRRELGREVAMDWLRRILDRGAPARSSQAPRRVFDLLGAAERDTIVANIVDERLSLLGLTRLGPRTWIDGSAPPTRRMFQLQLLKGASLKTTWGYSLDFVPHLSGGGLRWHRTDKSAMLDVIVDPKDLPALSYSYGAAQWVSDLERALPLAIDRACETWRRGSTWRGMLDIVQDMRSRQSNGLAFDNYTQLPLTLVLLSAKVGDLPAADAELECLVRQRGLSDEVAAKLAALTRNLANSRGEEGGRPT